MNGDRHGVLFEDSNPMPSNYRVYRDSVHARLVQLLRQHPGAVFSRSV